MNLTSNSIRSSSIASPISDKSHVAASRRKAKKLLENLFNETEIAEAEIVTTELANNLLKHAEKGEILFRSLSYGNTIGIEIIASDKGPGIANVAEAFRDGYSTAGSSGTGLGAIHRLSSHFELYTSKKGTTLFVQMWSTSSQKIIQQAPLDIGAVCLPISGEGVPGDGWALFSEGEQGVLMLVDGLGHGPQAAEAARKAIKVFQHQGLKSPSKLIEIIHAALRHTRGAAMAIATLDYSRREIQFAGIGNITGVIYTPDKSRHMTSFNGIVGHRILKIREFTYAWPKDSLLILHSDGIKTRWQINAYPGLATKHPGLVSGVLYRDYNRGNDDATIFVARMR